MSSADFGGKKIIVLLKNNAWQSRDGSPAPLLLLANRRKSLCQIFSSGFMILFQEDQMFSTPKPPHHPSSFSSSLYLYLCLYVPLLCWTDEEEWSLVQLLSRPLCVQRHRLNPWLRRRWGLNESPIIAGPKWGERQVEIGRMWGRVITPV